MDRHKFIQAKSVESFGRMKRTPPVNAVTQRDFNTGFFQQLHQTIGNQAVQRMFTLMLKPQPIVSVRSSRAFPVLQLQPQGAGSTWRHGDVVLFEETQSGIHLRVGINTNDKPEKELRTALAGIAGQIANDNKLITDPAYQVKTCFIAPTTTRFALYQGNPVLMIDPPNAEIDSVRHEMGHAIFYYLGKKATGTTSDASKAENFQLKISDIYHRLNQTKSFEFQGETHPAGLWMVDPTQWAPASKKEHPWGDPDEFFASAKEAYQRDRAKLKTTIERFVKLDGQIKAPAAELLALLDLFFVKGKLPTTGLTGTSNDTAIKELQRITEVSKVETTLQPGAYLDWLINPGNRPEPENDGPSIQPESTPPSKPDTPNMVTGKGGVVDQMNERFQKRIIDKVIESVEDLP